MSSAERRHEKNLTAVFAADTLTDVTGEAVAFGVLVLGHFLGLGIIAFVVLGGENIDLSWMRPGDGRGPGSNDQPKPPKGPDRDGHGFALPLDDAGPQRHRLREPHPASLPAPVRRGSDRPGETHPRPVPRQPTA